VPGAGRCGSSKFSRVSTPPAHLGLRAAQARPKFPYVACSTTMTAHPLRQVPRSRRCRRIPATSCNFRDQPVSPRKCARPCVRPGRQVRQLKIVGFVRNRGSPPATGTVQCASSPVAVHDRNQRRWTRRSCGPFGSRRLRRRHQVHHHHQVHLSSAASRKHLQTSSDLGRRYSRRNGPPVNRGAPSPPGLRRSHLPNPCIA